VGAFVSAGVYTALMWSKREPASEATPAKT
jgi:hypothetical protein